MMEKEYSSTLAKLKILILDAREVVLTLERQMEFDDTVIGHLSDLIDDIEEEGTE